MNGPENIIVTNTGGSHDFPEYGMCFIEFDDWLTLTADAKSLASLCAAVSDQPEEVHQLILDRLAEFRTAGTDQTHIGAFFMKALTFTIEDLLGPLLQACEIAAPSKDFRGIIRSIGEA